MQLAKQTITKNIKTVIVTTKIQQLLFATVWLKCVKHSECTLGFVICCAVKIK